MHIPSLLLTNLFLLAIYSQSQPGHFSSTRGFSFDYPKQWIVATKEQKQIMQDKSRYILAKLGDVDLNRMAVIVFDPQDDDFIESLNVVITQGKIPVNGNSRQEHARIITRQMRNAGVELKNVRSEIVSFSGRKAISVRWTIDNPLMSGSVSQWQVAMPGRNQTYILTASAGIKNFAIYESSFRMIFESFVTDGGKLGFWHSLPRSLQYAVIGGAAGAVFGALICLFKKRPGKLKEGIRKA